MMNPEAPPGDRFCDLVMKGGITSGVVYPKAIGLLSKHYRFKSIGGTSAGAIAAAVTAAAEYQRRTTGSTAGFERLETLPEELKTPLAGTRRSKLLSLFQPQPGGTRRLFSVLITSLNSKGTLRRVARIVGGFLLAYWPATVLSLIVAGLAWYAVGWFTGALVWLLATLASIGAWVYLDLTRRVVGNGFGLCTGMTEESTEALTPWLHALIQEAAGPALKPGEPLTFGHLWAADDPPAWLADGGPWRAIDLQMFTTSLAHGRPYVFPLPARDEAASRFRSHDRLYFRKSELARYLPPDVLAWMVDKGERYALEPGREEKDPLPDKTDELYALPEPADFPVVLAARMSLSFPLLFAAVPLHAIDHDTPGRHPFRPCWFSDGGISSNFPMHLFDGLVPSWPTFGINLEAEIEGRETVYLPPRYEEGYGERWNRFAEQSRSASRFGGFVGAIVGTMQNWNDNSLARMPGVRDRIARVRLTPNEGGMNLNMEDHLIEAISNKGLGAAQQLVGRFAVAPPGAQAPGWDEHRFVRLNTLVKMIAERAPGVVRALSPHCAHATDFSTLLARLQAAPNSPPGYETALSAAQVAALNAVIASLGNLVTALKEPANAVAFKPVPKPELRVRPPL